MYLKHKIGVFFISLCVLSCTKNDDAISQTPEDIFNKVNIYPAPPEQWMGGSESYFTAGYMGDIMPFFDNGKFNVFFLHDAISKPAGKGFHDIHSFETSNFLDFNYNGRMIPYGEPNEADFAIGTGSVVKANGVYYFYYTGHNGNANFVNDNPRESVLCATSTDLKNWSKIEDFKMTAPAGYYDFDFRDPHVFFNEDTENYWMLMSTQTEPGRKAVVLLFTSDDLASNNWTVENPVYTTTPAEDYLMLECADMFKMGNYWYLIFSENWSAYTGTHYRMATSSNGPWTTPENDRFDGEYFYAAKTASNGTDRFIFGWTARKSPENNDGGKNWAGNMVTHQLVQNANGTLKVQQPVDVANLFTQEQALVVESTSGNVQQNGNSITLQSGSCKFNVLKSTNQIKFNLSMADEGKAGMILSDDLSEGSGIKIVFEPANNRIASYVHNGTSETYISHVPFDFSQSSTYNVSLTINNDVCVMYINDTAAFSNRVYNIGNTNWSMFSDNTDATFSNIQIKTP